MRDYDLFDNKHIPLAFKANSRYVRLEVLAGLVDTDGYLIHNCFEIIQKSKQLAEDIQWLARSVGLAATLRSVQKTCTNNGVTRTYHKVTIYGDTEIVPVRLLARRARPRQQKRRVTDYHIQVTPVGPGEYYGFELSGDGLFLLGDFTVTHNTHLAISMARAGVLLYRPKDLGECILTVWDMPSYVSAIKSSYDNGNTQEVQRSALEPAILVMDDLGTEHVKAAPWYQALMYDVINARWLNHRATIVTTNLPLHADMGRESLEKRLGTRVLSRLLALTGKPVMISGKDYRYRD
ncbi:ATP-binding protein [Chloroflexota bacterium]